MNEELEWLKHANETIAQLKAELAQAKAELSDILAPTIDLLNSLKEYQSRYKQPHLEEVKAELSRLRSITERKP